MKGSILATWAEITGRKMVLAELVRNRLATLGFKVELYKGRVNSAGHKDQVVVWAENIGFVHVSAHKTFNINASNFRDGNQRFLADKAMIAFGWADDNCVNVHFVPAHCIKDNPRFTRDEIANISDKKYNFTIPNLFM
jgi:hypothetical protein